MSGSANGTISTPRVLGVFASWRLQAYGYTLATGYAAFALYLYHLGVWLLNKKGVPIYHDFTFLYVPGRLALHGQTAAIAAPPAFVEAQEAIVGVGRVLFANWGYPPIYFLILAPLAIVPYIPAFFVWGMATLAGYVGAVYAILRRHEAIALSLASPFAAWNFIAGQGGALTAALLAAALYNLERRPALAGILLGCLTYKPHWGILIPVALLAGRVWRAIIGAALTTAFLAALSVAFFGIGPWLAFPHGLAGQADLNLFPTAARWGLLQSVYGLVRYLRGGSNLAWIAQAVTTATVAMIVWLVWRSRTRYTLKAAVLSAAVLLATPYSFAYDLVAIAVPIAFLAKDQSECGLRYGEQTALLAIFGLALSAFLMAGNLPIGVPVAITLLSLVLRRAALAKGIRSSHCDDSRAV